MNVQGSLCLSLPHDSKEASSDPIENSANLMKISVTDIPFDVFSFQNCESAIIIIDCFAELKLFRQSPMKVRASVMNLLPFGEIPFVPLLISSEESMLQDFILLG